MPLTRNNIFKRNESIIDSLTLTTGTATAILDEDNLISNSATAIPTQQSVKTYVDGAVGPGFAWSASIITSNTTLAVNEGYFVDNSGSPTFGLDLPASGGSPALVVGDTIVIKDYAGVFDTANMLVSANGTDKIEGFESPNSYNIAEKGSETRFVWSGSTRGWMITSIV